MTGKRITRPGFESVVVGGHVTMTKDVELVQS